MCVRTSIFNAPVRAGFRCGSVLLVWLLLGLGTAAHGLSFRLESDQLWLEADHVPLTELLAAFRHAGVRVYHDPSIQRTVTARLQGVDLEDALPRVLRPLGYALIWEMMHGPLGKWPKLAEIHVFQTGPQRVLVEFKPVDALEVRTWPGPPEVEYVADEVVIGFSPDAEQQAILLAIREWGGVLVESIPDMGLYRMRLPPGTHVPALLEQLRQNPLVGAVEPNYVYRMPPPDVGVRDADASSERVTRSVAPEGTPPVAVLDSGVVPLPGLEALLRKGFNALNPEGDTGDSAGHGTQMALVSSGVIRPEGAGEGSATSHTVPIMGIRTFNDDGMTSNFAVLRSLRRAAEEGARVLNMSWGSVTESDFLAQAARLARREGILLVAAAGNEPLNLPVYPAAYPEVLAVSAVDRHGKPWTSSNFGDFIDLAAHSEAVFPIGYRGAPGPYIGTSIATAYVSHAAGLYFARYPDATPEDALRAMRRAISGPDTVRNDQIGYGILNEAAIQHMLQQHPMRK